MDLKWSQFVFHVRSRNNEGKVILKSTLTGAVVIMEIGIKEAIDSFLENGSGGKYSKKVIDYIDPLVELKMLVPKDFDEKKNYFLLFNNIRNNDSTFGIYLVTTTNCQLKCPYCYERDINQEQFLNIAIADKIISWCQKYIKENKQCKKFRTILYGGEPLLNKKVIKYILPELYEIARNNNLTFDTQIVTNGVLLDSQTVLFLTKYNLSRVQVTIDGPPEVHNKRRMKKNGEGTFNQIFQNVLELSNSGTIDKVSIRVNFDRDNFSSIPELLDILVTHELQKSVELSFGIITSNFSSEPMKKYRRCYADLYGFSELENAEKYLWLCEKAKRKGFVVSKEFMLGPWCSARAIHSVLIEPDGSLMKCFSGVGRKEFVFGNINCSSDCSDSRFSNFEYMEECFQKKCPYVPICGGGCRFEAFAYFGNFQKPFCQFNLIDKINKGLLCLNYD